MVSKNDEFCITNVKSRIQNEEFFMKNEEHFVFKMMSFADDAGDAGWCGLSHGLWAAN